MNLINIVTQSPHTSAIIAGFLMLKEQKKIDFEINFNKENQSAYPIKHFVEAIIDGKRIIFDMLDGYNEDVDFDKYNKFIEKVDYVFKRSFSENKNSIFSRANRAKIYPLGFNYHVTYPANPIDKLNFKQKCKQLIKLATNRKPATYYTPKVFESGPNYKKDDLQIIFFTRLFAKNSSASANKDLINSTRIEIIRKLKIKYPNNFKGGIFDNQQATRLCPDLIIPKKYTKRHKYLEVMKHSDICIGSMGLYESIGWKTGEYIAASRAIVNERFHYSVPGDFRIGKNYYSFDTAEECMAHVEYLFSHPDIVYKMKQENQHYYNTYLRPDVQVLNALKKLESSKPLP